MARSLFPADHPGVILDPSVTVWAASELTGYNIQHIRRLVFDGRLEAKRVGRAWLIKIASLEAYLAEAARRDHRFGPRTPANPDEDEENASA